MCNLFMRLPAQFTVQAGSRINNMFNVATIVETGVSKVKFGLCDSLWATDNNDESFVTISQILIV